MILSIRHVCDARIQLDNKMHQVNLQIVLCVDPLPHHPIRNYLLAPIQNYASLPRFSIS